MWTSFLSTDPPKNCLGNSFLGLNLDQKTLLFGNSSKIKNDWKLDILFYKSLVLCRKLQIYKFLIYLTLCVTLSLLVKKCAVVKSKLMRFYLPDVFHRGFFVWGVILKWMFGTFGIRSGCGASTLRTPHGGCGWCPPHRTAPPKERK